MRNQKGITMISLVIYIVAFSIIIGIVGAVTTFFSNNVSGLNESAGKNAEYNKFNVYMSEYTKNGYQVTIGDYGENSNPYIAFEKEEEQVVFEKIDDVLYMDNSKLCDKVEEFEAVLSTTENGQEVLKTKIKINGTVFTNDYVLEFSQVADEEEPIDNSNSLILGFVDDLGTRSTIYLYNNIDKVTSGTITVTMPDNTTKNITALADTSIISNTANYATYTVSKNGVYEFQATNGTSTTTTKIKVKNIEKFTDISTLGLSYASSEQNAYNYNGAAIPKGYYVDTKSKVGTGLVITDAIDGEGYSTGNEWVWVPVNETVGNADFYLTGSGTVAGTNVQYTKYSKLWQFTTDPSTGVNTRTDLSNPQVQPSDTLANVGFREPAILTDVTGGENANLGSINKRGRNTPFTAEEGIDAVALQYVTDFNNMCDSVDKYGGFFIGRYELTSNGEKNGSPVVHITWGDMYNQCMILQKDFTETGMIYDTLWDATSQWLAKSGYKVGTPSGADSEYGIFKTAEVSINNGFTKIILKSKNVSTPKETGLSSYSRTNNVYDLCANYAERTQGSLRTIYKSCRGGAYSQGDSNCYVSSRGYAYFGELTWTLSSRACMYIKTNKTQPIDNSQSLISALVDDLGTRSTIYIYNNKNQITSGTITVTMPNGTTKDITALADTSNISDTANYATYTVSQNGTYRFQATDGTNTTTTTVEIKNIEKFTDSSIMGLSYYNNENKAYNYNGAAVPVGYYVDTKSKVNTGLVITDAIDSEGYSTGNEWVWVPVNSTVGNNDFYLTGSGTVAGTSVPYTKYSKLWQFTTDSSTGVNTRTGYYYQGQPSDTNGNMEPALISDANEGEAANLSSINKRSTNAPFTAEDGVDAVASQYVTDFNNMCVSVDKYGGFYIGRYEITSNGEKPGTSLVYKSWYQFYNQCMTYGKTNTESGMIYGSLWDATMQWLAKSNYWVGNSGQTYNGYANYKTEEVSITKGNTKIIVKSQGVGQKLGTGQTSYTKSNGIYDLAGNCYDWTQEKTFSNYRVYRGCIYDTALSNATFTAIRHYQVSLTGTYNTISSRPCLYIK